MPVNQPIRPLANADQPHVRDTVTDLIQQVAILSGRRGIRADHGLRVRDLTALGIVRVGPDGSTLYNPNAVRIPPPGQQIVDTGTGVRAFATALVVGAMTVTVTGLNLPLPAVADMVDAKVWMPSATAPGNQRITAHPIIRTLTSEIVFSLSGSAEVTGYLLVGTIENDLAFI